MNSTDSTTDGPAPKPDLIELMKEQSRSKRIQAYAIMFMATAIVMLLIAIVVQARTNANIAIAARKTSEANGKRVDALTKEVQDAQGQIAVQNQDTLDRLTCEKAISSAVNRASADQLGAISGLVEYLASIPVAERTAESTAVVIDAIHRTGARYNAVLDVEKKYTDPATPVKPCPLEALPPE